MTKGSKYASANSGSKAVATTVSSGAAGSYQSKSQVSYGDKQTGSYGIQTTTEKASAGDFHWKNGTSGTRSAYTQSSTVRVGDRSGYTEVRNQQTVRNVTYNKSGSGSKSYIGGGSGGKGCEYAVSAWIVPDSE